MNHRPPKSLPPLPLAAMMLAGSVSASLGSTAWAQNAAGAVTGTLGTVTVQDKTEVDMAEGKHSVRATESRIGKGQQALRDIPKSVTVVTEKLLDDRNLDTVKEALKNTAGISFLAAEGGEEDIRLRGFSLQAAGDVFMDGVRDPAFYDRDTFNLDRMEVLRGSASMPPENLQLGIDASGQYFLGTQAVAADALEGALRAHASREPQPQLYIRGDRQVPYAHVAEAMSAAQRAGLASIGFVTEDRTP